jgi:hypothetical protein
VGRHVLSELFITFAVTVVGVTIEVVLGLLRQQRFVAPVTVTHRASVNTWRNCPLLFLSSGV